MGCERRLCRGCDTSWEGIHYCVRCLAERRGDDSASSGHAGLAALALLVAGLLALVHQLRLVDAKLVAALFAP